MDLDLYKIAHSMMTQRVMSHRAYARNTTLAHWVCVATGAEFVTDDAVRAVPDDPRQYVLNTRWVVDVRDRAARLLDLTEDEATALFAVRPTLDEHYRAFRYVWDAVDA